MAKKKIKCYTKKKNDGASYVTCLPGQKKAKRKAAKKVKKRRTIFDAGPASPPSFVPPQQPLLASFLHATALGKRKRQPKKRFDIEGY